jgi:membrane protease subunit (stomatin/prohibitin family)
MGVNVRCYGKYTFRLDDMGIFMRIHAGTANVIRKGDITEQMRSEVMAAFQNVLNEMGNSNHRVPVLELPSYTDEIKQAMDEKVFDEPIRARGVRLVSFTIESVSLDDASQKKIDRYEYSTNNMMQQGKIIDVMETAAGNEAGAVGGFMGVGMANMGSGGMTGGAMQNAWNGVQESYQQLLLAQRGIEQAEENLRLNRDYYKAGTSKMSDLLEAQLLYQQSLDRRTDAFADYQNKLLEYRQATGQ